MVISDIFLISIFSCIHEQVDYLHIPEEYNIPHSYIENESFVKKIDMYILCHITVIRISNVNLITSM